MQRVNTGTEKPAEVAQGIKLLYISLALGVLNGIQNFALISSGPPVFFTLLVMIFSLGIILFLIIKISQRRNWARVTFLVLFLLGLPFAVLSYADAFRRNSSVGVLSVAITALQLTALYLLFRRGANEWFRGHKVTPEVG